jgi:prepilin-type processing-associated H-X9-DG protein
MPIAYVDINSLGTGITRDTTVPNRVQGALRATGTVGTFGLANNVITNWASSTSGDIPDGLSKTIAMMEDVGRSEAFFTAKYTDPVGTGLLPTGNTFRNGWRWAEPDSANGVSGPQSTQTNPAANPATGGSDGAGTGAGFAGNGTATFGDAGLTFINNSNTPFGGPTWCNWKYNNCGPNDEPYSFHGAGCNVVFMDGHVSFLQSTINGIVLRRLLTPNEGLPIQDINGNPFSDY